MRATFLWILLLIPLSLFTLPFLLALTTRIMESTKITKRGWYVVLIIVAVLTEAFIVIPIDNRLVRHQKKEWLQQERIDKEMIKDMLQEVLKERDVHVSRQAFYSLVNDIYEDKNYYFDYEGDWRNENVINELIDSIEEEFYHN